MPTTTRAARRPVANRSRRTPLRRDEIVDVAIGFAQRGELDAMTMRRVASDLGVTAMALYAHVVDKDELLDEIIDYVLAHDAAPLPGTTEWRTWFRDAASRLRSVLIEHPALLDRYCRHPVGVSAALRRMEVALEVLHRAGFDDTESAGAYATVHTYTLGFAALEIARRGASHTESRRHNVIAESSPHFWPAYFAGLPADEFPNLRRLTPDLGSFTDDAQFERGLDCVLDGLWAQHTSAR
jgi:AcrR family transcriptional regulator